jgi:hypothetical protein
MQAFPVNSTTVGVASNIIEGWENVQNNCHYFTHSPSASSIKSRDSDYEWIELPSLQKSPYCHSPRSSSMAEPFSLDLKENYFLSDPTNMTNSICYDEADDSQQVERVLHLIGGDDDEIDDNEVEMSIHESYTSDQPQHASVYIHACKNPGFFFDGEMLNCDVEDDLIDDDQRLTDDDSYDEHLTKEDEEHSINVRRKP